MARDGPFTGHAHFWERAMSRRQFLSTTAAATGAAVTSPLWLSQLALADAAATGANPIPGGITPFGLGPFHVFVPPLIDAGQDPSTITDFNGALGVAHVSGAGTDTSTGNRLTFDTDMRFMKGVFRGVDGALHKGSFAFV